MARESVECDVYPCAAYTFVTTENILRKLFEDMHQTVYQLLTCIAIPLLILIVPQFEKKDELNSSKDTTQSSVQNVRTEKGSRTKEQVDVDSGTKADGKVDKKTATGNSDLTVWDKFTAFYSAPIIKFMHNIISFIAFLILYSYVLISKLEPHISVPEIIRIVWVFSFFVEEIMQVSRRQISRKHALHLMEKLRSHFEDHWNILDLITILLFVVGISLRFTPYPIALEAAQVVMGIDLMFYFLRILPVFHAQRQIGPKLVMILNMMQDLLSVAAIIGVFFLAYAIASFAILYPNTELNIHTVMFILRRPYWNMFGELMLEEIEGDENCSDNEALYINGTMPRCPTKSGQYIVPVMMGIYTLMTNIVLLSLLIATFSYSIERVQKDPDWHCSFRRYNLICEYFTKPWLAQPLALLYYLLMPVWKILHGSQAGAASSETKIAFSKDFKTEDKDELCRFEKSIAHTVHQKKEQERLTRLDNKVDTTVKLLNQLENKVDKLQQAQQAVIKEQKKMEKQPIQIQKSLHQNYCSMSPGNMLTGFSELPLHGARNYFQNLVAEKLDASF